MHDVRAVSTVNAQGAESKVIPTFVGSAPEVVVIESSA
jgi:hypothetical protein